MTRNNHITAAAKSLWNAERALLAKAAPYWPMPSWSRAPAWRRRAYILAAQAGGWPRADD